MTVPDSAYDIYQGAFSGLNIILEGECRYDESWGANSVKNTEGTDCKDTVV